MAHPYHHALSSVRKWGGKVEDYLAVHNWFDESKAFLADFRHRALRHHAEGIFLCETIFGLSIAASEGKVVPVRWVGERHVREDLGRIPAASDWLRCIRPEAWMGQAQKLSKELERGIGPGLGVLEGRKNQQSLARDLEGGGGLRFHKRGE